MTDYEIDRELTSDELSLMRKAASYYGAVIIERERDDVKQVKQ